MRAYTMHTETCITDAVCIRRMPKCLLIFEKDANSWTNATLVITTRWTDKSEFFEAPVATRCESSVEKAESV